VNDQEPPGEPPRRRRTRGLRAAILEAARHAFAEQGYTRTTRWEIARRAGVTQGVAVHLPRMASTQFRSLATA